MFNRDLAIKQEFESTYLRKKLGIKKKVFA